MDHSLVGTFVEYDKIRDVLNRLSEAEVDIKTLQLFIDALDINDHIPPVFEVSIEGERYHLIMTTKFLKIETRRLH